MTEKEKNDLINYRLSRAKETLSEIQILIENKLWHTSINRIYYACYYAVIALLSQNNFSTHTHSGVRQLLGLHFVKTGLITKDLGRFFNNLYDKRQTGDYDDFIKFEKDEVIYFYENAKVFISKIEKIIKS